MFSAQIPTQLQEFTTQADFVRDTLMQLEPQAEYGRCGKREVGSLWHKLWTNPRTFRADVTNLLRVLYVMHIRNPGYISMHLILTHPFTSLGEMSSSSSPATSTGSSRPSVTRAIVVYGRSTVLPQVCRKVLIDCESSPIVCPSLQFNSPYIEEQVRAKKHPQCLTGRLILPLVSKLRNELALCSNIFLDFIYLYDREADEQEVTTIFNFWYGFDDRDRFHGYNLARCGRELPEAVAALVAHPLQRPQMKDVRHNIEVGMG